MSKSAIVILIILVAGLIAGTEARMYIVDDDGFGNYKTISEAVENAKSGDTIYVKSGIYQEHLILDKTLVIMPPTGEDGPCVLDGDGSEIGIEVLAEGCRIEGLTIKNFRGPGIYLDSDGNEIRNNLLEENVHGIFLNGSLQNFIENNIERGGYCGIVLLNSGQNQITTNQAEDTLLAGILLNNSLNNILKDCKESGCARAVYLITNSRNNLIDDHVVTDCKSGILLKGSSRENEVHGCRVVNTTTALGLKFATRNFIHENEIINSENGISLVSSEGCGLQKNRITKVDYAIILSQSSSNKVLANEIIDGDHGIVMSNSSLNVLQDNALTNVSLAFYVDGKSEESFDNQVEESNQVDGKPILYYYGKSGLTISERECAHMTLAYCQNSVIEKNDILNDVLFVYNSEGNAIQENNVSGCYGMRIYNSSNNQIVKNQACNNKFNGIALIESTCNRISSNMLSQNNLCGVLLMAGSEKNEIVENTFLENRIGINLVESNDNLIYHNNFVNNTEQAIDDGENLWDWGALKGGNYWSDHPCEGKPCQNNLQKIGENITDYYPFGEIDGWLHQSIV